MWSTLNMFYSGAVEAVAGIIVSRIFSLITSRQEMQEGLVSSTTSRQEMQDGLNVTLYNLQQEVIKIKSAIDATRGRRITSENFLKWLADLTNAAYLGEYYYRTFKNRSSLHLMIAGTEDAISRPTKRQRTERTLPFGNEERRELHDVLELLKVIDMHAFLLEVNALPERPIKRYLYMEPTRLINRCKEREQVMKFLFEPSMAGENNVDILPILGPSGAGKTTLALHCFYDPKVENQFPLKIYIPSPVWSAHYIFIEILQKLNNTGIINFDENTVVTMLKQNLSSERILLVINDFLHWDPRNWDALLGCLRCAKQGSKVISISKYRFTRFKSIRDITQYKSIRDAGMVAPVMVDKFCEDEYKLFFREHAFGSVDPEDFPELAKMGEIIAKKMNGSIWGAKIIGEILRENLSADFWEIFLQDGILTSQFLKGQGLRPAIETISQVLPKRLRMETAAMAIRYGSRSLLIEEPTDVITTILFGTARGLLYSNQVKSFRELMVLGPKHFTPVIKEGENDWLPFLVAKHFDLHDSIDIFAICQIIGDESENLLESPKKRMMTGYTVFF